MPAVPASSLDGKEGVDGSSPSEGSQKRGTSATPERSAARYELKRGVLRLHIDADQPAWRVEDGEMRVSNIQTGTFAGPVGSPIGQHRHRPDLAVATPQVTRRLYTPSFGLAEAVLRAGPDPTCMLAVWLVGFEEQSPDSSAPDQVRFFVDDQLVRAAYQRIDYPLQLMVDLFEFPAGADRDTAAYPKIGEVKAVRGYRRP